MLPAVVRVVAADHPLAGRELRARHVYRRYGRRWLVLELPDGGATSVEVENTDVLDTEPVVPAASGASTLSCEGARRLLGLLKACGAGRERRGRGTVGDRRAAGGTSSPGWRPMIVGWRVPVPSWGVSRIWRLGGMTIPAPEPDPDTRERSRDAVAGGGDRSAAARGGLRLVSAGQRGAARAAPELGASAAAAIVGPAGGDGAPARRLRLPAPAPAQLELVSGREGPGPEVVWASLPERTRETVLVLLARLIGVGVVEGPEA